MFRHNKSQTKYYHVVFIQFAGISSPLVSQPKHERFTCAWYKSKFETWHKIRRTGTPIFIDIGLSSIVMLGYKCFVCVMEKRNLDAEIVYCSEI